MVRCNSFHEKASRCQRVIRFLFVVVATLLEPLGDRSTRLPFALCVTPVGVGAH